MKKRHIISICGDLASGKGTVAKIISDDLNFGIYKNGEYFRSLAREHGMDVTSFNKYVESHPEIDIAIEKSAGDYASTHDNFIIDARLGWYAVPESFKVYLKVDLNESAKRAFNDPHRKSSENFATIEEQKADIEKRYKLENMRYWNLYHVRKDDMSNYDLIIDTTKLTPREVADKIKEEYYKWLEK